VRPHLGADDFRGALGVFLLVVLATFPVVVPFMVFEQTPLAVRASNFVALGMLFVGGWILARYAGGSRWRGGAVMAATGAVLMAAIMALGG
jgi:VIT1/CCC1 family predicted Fe2+/Mn2+ transporter